MAADQPLRALHLVTSDAYAGLERHAVNLAGELRALGCGAEIACPPSAARMREEALTRRIPVHPPAGRPGPWLGAVARRVATDRPDVIHLHDGRSALIGALLSPLARGAVVRTQHFTRPASVERDGWRGRVSLVLHRGLNRNLDGYVAVSRAAAASASARRETGRAEVVVIPPGIRLPAPGAVERALAARRGEPWPVVTFIGRLESEKRVEVLVEAMPRVLRQLPQCRFVIAGAGSAEEQLKARARELDVEYAVSWPGWVREPDAVLEQTHIYVNTWPWEGFGMAMAEAMAYSLPVVAADSGASPELVEDGVTGRLVPPADPHALAAAIVSLAGDRNCCDEMGETAHRRAVANYGIEQTARQTLAFYQTICDPAG